jgi:hypothetical protein
MIAVPSTLKRLMDIYAPTWIETGDAGAERGWSLRGLRIGLRLQRPLGFGVTIAEPRKGAYAQMVSTKRSLVRPRPRIK